MREPTTATTAPTLPPALPYIPPLPDAVLSTLSPDEAAQLADYAARGITEKINRTAKFRPVSCLYPAWLTAAINAVAAGQGVPRSQVLRTAAIEYLRQIIAQSK